MTYFKIITITFFNWGKQNVKFFAFIGYNFEIVFTKILDNFKPFFKYNLELVQKTQCSSMEAKYEFQSKRVEILI